VCAKPWRLLEVVESALSMAIEDKFNINLNQNCWALVIAYAALGAAEHWTLGHLQWLARILAVATTLSMIATLVAYTWNYCKKKFTE
jgi:hypothetical protein